ARIEEVARTAVDGARAHAVAPAGRRPAARGPRRIAVLALLDRPVAADGHRGARGRYGRGGGRRRRGRRRGGGRRGGRGRAEADHGAGAVGHDLLRDALALDQRLDGGGLSVTGAARDLVERLGELGGRLVEAAAHRVVHGRVVLRGLRVAQQPLLGSFARCLAAGRLTLARGRGAVGGRGAGPGSRGPGAAPAVRRPPPARGA